MAGQQQGNAGILLQSVDRLYRIMLAVFCAALLSAAAANASDFSEPWKRKDRALVIDAYEYNPIDWQRLASDKRIVGFINKASDGLPPAYDCSGSETRGAVVQGAVEAPCRGARTLSHPQDRGQGARPEMGRLPSRAAGQSDRAGQQFHRFRRTGSRRSDRPRHRGKRPREMDVA